MIESSLQYPGTCPIVEEIEDGDSEPSKLSSIQPVPSNEGGGIKLVSYNRRRSLAPALKLMNAGGGHRRGSVIALPRFQESNLIVCHYTVTTFQNMINVKPIQPSCFSIKNWPISRNQTTILTAFYMSECDTYCETIIFCRLSTLFYRRDSLANQQPNRRESLAKLRRQSLAQIERQSSSFQQQRSATEYNVRGIAVNPQSRGYNYDRRRSSVLGQCLTKLTRIEQSHV